MASRSLDASSSVSDGNAHKAASDLLHRPERASSSVPVLGRAPDGADLQDHDADGVRHDVMGLAGDPCSLPQREAREHAMARSTGVKTDSPGVRAGSSQPTVAAPPATMAMPIRAWTASRRCRAGA
jgi:hypothetical protein